MLSTTKDRPGGYISRTLGPPLKLAKQEDLKGRVRNTASGEIPNKENPNVEAALRSGVTSALRGQMRGENAFILKTDLVDAPVFAWRPQGKGEVLHAFQLFHRCSAGQPKDGWHKFLTEGMSLTAARQDQMDKTPKGVASVCNSYREDCLSSVFFGEHYHKKLIEHSDRGFMDTKTDKRDPCPPPVR